MFAIRPLLPFALIALGACVCAQPAFTQKQLNADDLSGLSKTDRETLHPGDALRVIGIDQEDNQFRNASPALSKGELAATLVDTEELRQRKLAMYANGANFNAPPQTSRRVIGENSTRGIAPFVSDRDPTDSSPEEDPGSRLPFFAGGIALVGVVLLLRNR